MQQALQDLNKVAKVYGSFVNSDDGELLAFLAPDEFSEDLLREAGRIAIQGFQGIESTGYNVKKIELEFKNYRLINQRIAGGVISVICDTVISLPLLNLTFNVVSRKIETILKGGEVAPIPEKVKPVVVEKPKPVIEEKPIIKEEPAPMKVIVPEPAEAEEPVLEPIQPKGDSKYVKKIFFDLLEEDFAKRIGPMAKFIIDDYIDEMGEHRDTFPVVKVADLINKLSSEIDKRAERGKFKSKMQTAFEKSQ
jgi:predicted regulator of Ras-like GTPase activity (Roadblock/LC7/MglB family)